MRAAISGILALVALLVAPALPGATGGRVLAHAQLVASSPAAGTILEESPPELRLVFSEPLEAELTSLDVVAQDGTALLSHAGEIDQADPYALVVTDPNLPDGVYSITWRTLSAADGHTGEGFFTFGIGDVADELPAGPVGGMVHDERDLLAMVGRWLTYAGLLVALGFAVFHRVVVGGPMTRPMARLLAAGLRVAAVATLVTVGAAAIEAGDVGRYVTGRNGLLQVARAVIALAGAGLLLVVPGRLGGAVAAVSGLAGIALLVVAGHASALTGFGPIAGGVVHVVAAATWIGGLVGLLLLAYRPDLVAQGPAPSFRRAVPRFSALALVSIGMVGITGFYSAWSQTGSLLPVGTEYGRTLVLKGVAAIGALSIGALNYLDAGRMRDWLGGLRDRVGIEIALVGVVLAFTAALAVTPPVDQARGTSITPLPDAFGNVAPQMRLEIAPGRPGVNRMTVITTDALASVGGLELTLDRIDDGSTTRVPLTLAGLEGMMDMEGMDHAAMAARNDDGTIDWYADAIVLPAGSRWDTSVHVLSSNGTELTRQRFAFTLDDAGIAEGRVSSLLDIGGLIALVLVVGGALGIGLGAGGLSLPRCDAAASRVALVGGGAIGVALGLVVGIGGLVG